MRRKILSMLLAALMLFALLAGCGNSGGAEKQPGSTQPAGSTPTPIKVKVANLYAENVPETQSLYLFKEEVEKKTDGAIQIEIYPNGQLGTEDALLESVQTGSVEMFLSGGLTVPEIPYTNITLLPNIFRDYDHARRALEDPKIFADLTQGVEDSKLVVFPYTPSGFRAIFSNRPLQSMEDFKGLRLRVPNIPVWIEWATNLGSNPITMPMTEVFTALEQKVVDAQETPPSICRGNKFNEVSGYGLDSKHMLTLHLWLVNREFFESLTPEQQQIFADAITLANDYTWEQSEASDNADMEYFAENGMEIISPDDAFRQAMADSQQATYEWLDEQYPGSMEIIQEIIDFK
ncbi:hypothetical protein CE91St41_04070 [Oscillospiraceae bacterium]|nr:hypothetical protein CE91St40_04070 [Oscillospiraceae bacterium]BDF73518.1 hypothetical protein CE91St41_04070 [Oscillospiraceae bacterium]